MPPDIIKHRAEIKIATRRIVFRPLSIQKQTKGHFSQLNRFLHLACSVHPSAEIPDTVYHFGACQVRSFADFKSLFVVYKRLGVSSQVVESEALNRMTGGLVALFTWKGPKYPQGGLRIPDRQLVLAEFMIRLTDHMTTGSLVAIGRLDAFINSQCLFVILDGIFKTFLRKEGGCYVSETARLLILSLCYRPIQSQRFGP